ncbi:MAG: DUF4118 domain-containing protein [Atopobiaceae bacterium]|nr:DUF4118 domain-containing protein [Atopobiaceae bacterium]
MAPSSIDGLFDALMALPSAPGSSSRRSVSLNLLVMLGCQAVFTLFAILLDAAGFSDATVVIIFVTGVLVTAMLTDGQAYSLAASIVSILCYNYFLIDPRSSLQINGRDYAGTITAMVIFALLASSLVASLRRNAALSMRASVVAEREQLRANLLRSVSHDLRTPLTSISGNADMLLDDEVSLSDEVRGQLTRDIYDDATWLRAVVENLLAVTRLEDGDVMLNLDVELVDDVIEEAMRHVSRDARFHEIVVVPSNDLLLARLDPQVIVQVIVNLVNNAIAHTPKGSTITISSHLEGPMVAVEVADNGPGISDEDKDQVFELFYTAGHKSADVGRSMGLGLSLCRSIVTAHGGTIRVEDADPHGARFIFTLPAEEVDQHA